MRIELIDRDTWFGQATLENLPIIANRFLETLGGRLFSIAAIDTPVFDDYNARLYSGTKFKRMTRYNGDLFTVQKPKVVESGQYARFVFFAGDQYWEFETTLTDVDVKAQPYSERGFLGGFHVSFRGDDIVTRRSHTDGTETIRIFKLVEMSDE